MREFCMAMLSDLKKAKRGAIAKAISIMENDPKEARQLVKKIYKTSGTSIVIGITGPAGSGKSSLINKLSMEMKIQVNITEIILINFRLRINS